MSEQTASRGFARWVLERLGSLGVLGGIVVLIWEGSAPLSPWVRAAGALGFLVGAAADLAGRDRLRPGIHVSIGVSGAGRAVSGVGLIVTLSLAFNCTTRQHHSAQPLWLTLFGILILAVLLCGAVPYAVIVWRRASDEREKAIAYGSMAFALLGTVVFLLVFSSLRDLRVGPALQPDWALLVTAVSWFGAWTYLRRTM